MEWRRLYDGEVIQAGDEVDRCVFPQRGEPCWDSARPSEIGQVVPDRLNNQVRRRCPPPAIVAPWGDRAAELEDTEGTYANYAAWEEWWLARVQEEPCLEEIDAEIARPFLFAAFCKAIEESRIEDSHA